MKTYFHATSKENFKKILEDGVIKRSPFDKVLYLAESKMDALKFVYPKTAVGETIVVIEVKLPSDKLLVETFDHSPVFFQCKSYGYSADIATYNITQYFEYKKTE